jgi:hypothetical protein
MVEKRRSSCEFQYDYVWDATLAGYRGSNHARLKVAKKEGVATEELLEARETPYSLGYGRSVSQRACIPVV